MRIRSLMLLAVLEAALASLTPIVPVWNWLSHPRGMVRIPAGPFRPGPNRPVINLPEFYLDRFEVTNDEYAAFTKASGYHTEGNWAVYDTPGRGRHPVTGVTLADARAYARYYGKRLPSTWEWQKACSGSGGWKYPWGDRWIENAANINSRGDAAVGSFPQDCSPYGAFDMAGNVFEWTATRLSGHPTSYVVRGGAWIYLKEEAAADRAIDEGEHSRCHFLGFRCAWP